MIICSNCQSQQLDGTIFCSACGASLLALRRPETTAALGHSPSAAPARPESALPSVSATRPILTLTVLNSGRRVTLDVSEDRLIGRRDDPRGIAPDLDLSADGGYEAGVSRRHAIVLFKNGSFLVEDLGSSNGTFVNNRRVAAQATMSLQDGDELKCGTLVIRVEFE